MLVPEPGPWGVGGPGLASGSGSGGGKLGEGVGPPGGPKRIRSPGEHAGPAAVGVSERGREESAALSAGAVEPNGDL